MKYSPDWNVLGKPPVEGWSRISNQVTRLTPSLHIRYSASEIQRFKSFMGTAPGSGGFESQLNSVTQNCRLLVDTICPALLAAVSARRITGSSGIETSLGSAALCSGL